MGKELLIVPSTNTTVAYPSYHFIPMSFTMTKKDEIRLKDGSGNKKKKYYLSSYYVREN